MGLGLGRPLLRWLRPGPPPLKQRSPPELGGAGQIGRWLTAAVGLNRCLQLSYHQSDPEMGPAIVPAVPFPRPSATCNVALVGGCGLKAICQIPLCIAFVYLAVQILRVGAVTVLDYLIRHIEDNLEHR